MDKLTWLIEYLLREEPQYAGTRIPEDVDEQRQLLRALMNVRPPRPVSDEFLRIQDAYLQERQLERGVTDAESLTAEGGLTGAAGLTSNSAAVSIWQGDITTLKIDAIVNACNSQMLGCFQPLHGCIDNFIHTYAGVQLRLKMHEIMQAQGHNEPIGQAKITSGYNLPAKYILHTVGPIVQGPLLPIHKAQLRACYLACLDMAAIHGCRSIAFCCLSTGVFGFPQQPAAGIAVRTVREYLQQGSSIRHVVFNVFKDSDRDIYETLLT